MDRLGVLREIVPEGGRVVITGQVGGGIALLSVNEVRELGRISHWVCQRMSRGGSSNRHLQKNTGVLLATKSQLPSDVLNLTENPRGSLRCQ
jgi:hypothetical protein